MQDVLNLAQQIAGRLGYVDGIDAVALGGSWANGEATLDADITLLLYYRGLSRPSVAALREVALELNNDVDPEAVSEVGAQHIAGDGITRMWVEGRRVEWHYRDLNEVSHAIEDARNGAFFGSYRPGYTHGFFSHYLVGEVALARSVYDPLGTFANLNAAANPYPNALSKAITDAFMKEADLGLYAAQRAASDGDLFLAYGQLYRCAACLVQVVYARNQHYIVTEAAALRNVDGLPSRPANLTAVLPEVLGHPGQSQNEVYESIDRLRALHTEMQFLVQN